MKTIMLDNHGLTIQCENKLEEEWLEPIILALEKKEVIVLVGNNEDNLGFLTIKAKGGKDAGI